MKKAEYNPQIIEKKWQKYWKEHHTFKTSLDQSKPKYYVLDMFPYPSGAGLHVGHLMGYTATDIVARYKRHKGFNVLHPMGWDSFGLPAEQYAIRTGEHPATITKVNIDNFRRQLQSVGFSYDWDREVATSDPRYYKWTQWLFTKLYEKGLAYEAQLLVNYCPALGTALSNEEIENGRSKEGGYPIERRPLRQWVLKITAYAERLLEDLKELDWPEGLKKLQTNWIGKSEGALLDFMETETGELVTVFTTRPDTLFGATYLVVAPEHPIVAQITSDRQRKAVLDYQSKTASKSDLERTELNKEKSGVWTGAYAINPITKLPIPIWISDYVLASYGTGAIMSVPAHDERDFEFAKQFNLPIKAVVDPGLEIAKEFLPDQMESEVFRSQVLKGELCWEGEGKNIESRQDGLNLDGLKTAQSKEKMVEWLEKEGVGKRSISYKLRDWLFSRQRYWGEPFPILHFEDGSKRLLDLDELPLEPPQVKEYKPSEGGLSPLATVKEWVDIVDPKTGKLAKRETNTMPQWAGSCWYYLRFCDPRNTNEAWSPESERYWMPVDLYVGGAEHAVLHLLYARFWHKVFYDFGLVSTKEPFYALRNQGMITARSFQREGGGYVAPEDMVEKEGKFYDKRTSEPLRSQIEKMSKSKLNGVTPDDVIEEFGADALRLYEMFMGPLDKEKVWNTDAITGCKRFLTRFYDLVVSDKVTDDHVEEATRLAHRLLHNVTEEVDNMRFNTAVAKMMEFVNDFSKLPSYSKEALKIATLVLSPFAPHLAEESWELLGEESSLVHVAYPAVEERYLQDEQATYVIQVNGKVRGRFELPKHKNQEEILAIAKNHPLIQKYLTDEIKKVVFVPDKLLNLVI